MIVSVLTLNLEGNVVKIFKNSLILIFCFSCLLFKGEKVKAEEDANSGGFTYELVKPDNHQGGPALNLRLAAGEKQNLHFKLKNYAKTETVINIKIAGARTNNVGGLEYGPNKFKEDSSLKYDLTDLVKIPESITLQPEEEVEVPIEINMPEVGFDGVVLGGVQLQESDSENKEEKSEGQSVVNKLAYLFGMVISENDKKVTPKLSLKKVYPELSNYTNAIFVDMANTKATLINDMVTEVQIMKRGQSTSLYESKKTNMKMAPNSIIQYPVSLDRSKMVAGKYTAHISVVYDGQKKSWTKDFAITTEEADKFNEQDVNLLQERGIDWKPIVFAVAGVVGIILVIVIIGKSIQGRKKSKKPQKSPKIRKKSR